MAYDPEIYAAAVKTLAARRAAAEQDAALLRERACAQFPRLKEIDAALAATGTHIAHAILEGGNIDAAIARIQAENERLQAEMAELLQKGGFGVRNFAPLYTCPLCDDTGYHGGNMCTCLSKLLKEQAAARVCKGLSSDPKRFSDLSLRFYDDTPPAERALSPRERMRRIFAYCEQYAAAFSTHAPSLLLRGATGTGKTHVSLAIAGTVAENGFSVVYQPAGRLFGLLEEEHFGRRSGNTLETVLSCDLLVIDDLGTEFETSFVAATLYTIINTRMLDGLPTVISTNLTQEGLQSRYGDQTVSRITGAFEPLLFVGKDIRQQKRTAAMRS